MLGVGIYVWGPPAAENYAKHLKGPETSIYVDTRRIPNSMPYQQLWLGVLGVRRYQCPKST